MFRLLRLVCDWAISGFWLWVAGGMMMANPKSGWGVDAILSRHVDEASRAVYLEMLDETSMYWLRDRGTSDPSPRDAFEELQTAGHAVLAMAQDVPGGAGTAWGTLPADLRLLWLNARDTAKDHADTVDAWELHNEPELAWWPDMPDRYASHAKALYLGLKTGARAAGKDTPVLLGSLGLPPGPWLERSARNGLLAYADAWNVHYYGDDSQFTGFLDSNVKAMRDLRKPEGGNLKPESGDRKPEGGMAERRWPVKAWVSSGFKFHYSGLAAAPVATGRNIRSITRHWPVKAVFPSSVSRRSAVPYSVLPIWATEVGVNTVTLDTWADPVRRQRQADWIVSTARQARAHPHVAVFMPFVLVHKNDGYALTESPTRTWPAWDAYARFTRENPFPARPAVRPRSSGLPLQVSSFGSQVWSLTPQVSSFKSQVSPTTPNPVVLQWLADAETASGHKLAAAYRWRADGRPIRGELRLYNFGETAVRGRLAQTREPGDGGFHSSGLRFQVSANPTSDPLTVPAGGVISVPLSFALEDAPAGGRREWWQFAFIEESGRRSQLGFALERSPDLYPPESSSLPIAEWGSRRPRFGHVPHAVPSEHKGPWQTINGVRVLYAQGALARFQLGDRPFDSEYPPMAAAALPKGLPEAGWLRVSVRELGPAGVRVRVDLIDKDGRRFTQWENLGQVRGLPVYAPRWLNLLDFHPYAWGKLDKRRRLRPGEVREVQLRFYASRGPTMVDLELGFATDYGATLDPSGEVGLKAAPDNKTAPVE